MKNTMRYFVKWFIFSAGISFLFLATILAITNLTLPQNISSVSDPILHVEVPLWNLIFSALLFVFAVVCFFVRKEKQQLLVILTASFSFFLGRVLLIFVGAPGGLTGYLSDIGEAFSIPARQLNWFLEIVFIYLLCAGVVSLRLERMITTPPSRVTECEKNGKDHR